MDDETVMPMGLPRSRCDGMPNKVVNQGSRGSWTYGITPQDNRSEDS